MQEHGLGALLAANGVEIEDCQQVVYEALRMQCFAKICDIWRQNREEYIWALCAFRAMKNADLFAEMVVKKYSDYVLDRDSYAVLGKLFCAFFRKRDARRVYPEATRQRLADQQGHRCALCGKPIADKGELDHIIPWIYVGDEVDENLQLLCHKCNKKKSASFLYPLQVILAKGFLEKV